MLFCHDIKICRNFRTFGEFWGKKKCFFWSKTVFFVRDVQYFMVYIAYYTELNWQICIYAQKRRICYVNSKYAHDQKFLWPFLPSPNGCQLLPLCRVQHNFGWIGISYIYERSVALWAHQGLTFSALQFTIIKSDGCVFYKTKCSYIDRSYVQHWTCSKWSHVLHRWSMALITHTTSLTAFSTSL